MNGLVLSPAVERRVLVVLYLLAATALALGVTLGSAALDVYGAAGLLAALVSTVLMVRRGKA